MKAHQRDLLAACFLILLSACSNNTTVPATIFQTTPSLSLTRSSPIILQTFPATITPEFLPTAIPSPAPTPTPIPFRTHYLLDAMVDYEAQSTSVEETIIFINHSGEELPDLVLAVEPNLWPGCFDLISLTSDREVVATHLAGQKLTLKLASSLKPEDSLQLIAKYRLLLPRTAWGNDDITPNLHFGYTGKQLNLLNWYLFIVPYIPGEGWLLHEPSEFGEHLVYDEADFDVNVRFSNPAQAPIIAAPAEGEKLPDGWHYHLEDARTFALSLSPDFKKLSTTAGGVTLQSYFFLNDAEGGGLVLETAAKAVESYGEKFTPYPHPVLTIVQGDFIPSMEYDGLVFVGHMFYHYLSETPRNYLVVMTAHEVAHQWWFALVGNDQAIDPWLDEGLATYSESLYFEAAHPDAAGWWKEVRITRHEPLSGWVDMTIYDANSGYLQAVYLRAAKFLGELRSRVGDEAFFSFLKDYATTFSHHRATSDDFFHTLYLHTQVGVSDIIGIYFLNPH